LFVRFLGWPEDKVPDATAAWSSREPLAKAGLVKTRPLRGYLDAKVYIARGSQIVDTTNMRAPRQHNAREENEAIKAGKRPDSWEGKPTKNVQEDALDEEETSKASTATRTTSAWTASTS
jgi:hypothetical protein